MINEFYVEFVYIAIINKILIQHMWIFVYIVINEFYLLCRIFYLLSYVLEVFFLSYSFVMFRIYFLLSIWVNLHIYIDIVMFGFWVEIKGVNLVPYRPVWPEYFAPAPETVQKCVCFVPV